MSRITKFLKQTCSYEAALRDDLGKVQLDAFGEVLYAPARVLRCRREKTVQDVQTNTGAVLRSSTRYFTDESVEINADDRLDGKTVLTVEEYTNQLGKTEGYESYV